VKSTFDFVAPAGLLLAWYRVAFGYL